jgi:hypothetical protein
MRDLYELCQHLKLLLCVWDANEVVLVLDVTAVPSRHSRHSRHSRYSRYSRYIHYTLPTRCEGVALAEQIT